MNWDVDHFVTFSRGTNFVLPGLLQQLLLDVSPVHVKYLKPRMSNQLAISSTVQKFYLLGIFSLLLAHVVVTSPIVCYLYPNSGSTNRPKFWRVDIY